MECPADKMRKDENYKQIMLVAAGSAMAASCEPCLNHVIPNLIEIGVPDAEIRRAVEIGQYTLGGADGTTIDQGKYLVVWKNDGGNWKLHRDIWNTSRPA